MFEKNYIFLQSISIYLIELIPEKVFWNNGALVF